MGEGGAVSRCRGQNEGRRLRDKVRGGIMARLRVGVLGLNHDHVWGNLAALNGNELGQAVAAADPDPRLRERLAREHGGVEALPSYDTLLERADLDAVLIFGDNRASAELAVRALDRGLPVMIE